VFAADDGSDFVVGVIATNLSVAPSFHREVIVVFSMRPASLLRVCVRPAELQWL